MKKKIILLLILFIYSTCEILAQTQQGYVKTLGRPNQKGTALSGVTIRVKGAHNAILSNPQGKFSIPMTGKKNGDAYSLQQIQKQGYELNEAGIIGRQYAFSDKVPLNIVMVSTKQLQEDKLRIENKAYEVAEETYKRKIDLLEKQKKDKEITENNYRNQLRALQDKYAKYQSLIDELANHYAHVDYDNLNETEKNINLCIENGEIEKADSLLNTIFNPTDVLKRNQNALSALNKQISDATVLKEKAEAEMANILKQQEKDAEYLYQLFSISLARFDNEKARFYIETRAELDTLNIDWQTDAGYFCRNYLADFESTKKYYNCALNSAIKQKGLESMETVICLCNIATLRLQKSDLVGAVEANKNALDIVHKLFGDNSYYTAYIYYNLGNCYQSQGNYEESEQLYKKAISISRNHDSEETKKLIADCDEMLGVHYNSQGNYKQSLLAIQEALKINKSIYGDNHVEIITTLINLGATYQYLEDYSLSLKYYQQALEIALKILTPHHYLIANIYNNICIILHKQGDIKQAILTINKALTIWKELYGLDHPDLATSLANFAAILIDQKKYDDAIRIYKRALDIKAHAYGKKHLEIAELYHNISETYALKKDYYEAIVYEEKSISVLNSIYGKYHKKIAKGYDNIANIYILRGWLAEAMRAWQREVTTWAGIYNDYSKEMGDCYLKIVSYQTSGTSARYYCKLALEAYEKSIGKKTIEYSNAKIKEAVAYYVDEKYAKAVLVFKEAFGLRKEITGNEIIENEKDDIIMDYGKFGYCLLTTGEYKNTQKYYFATLPVIKKEYGENSDIYAGTLVYISLCYYSQENYKESLRYLEKAQSIYKIIDDKKSYNSLEKDIKELKIKVN